VVEDKELANAMVDFGKCLSLGSFVENRKRSEHRDISAARLVIGFRLIDHQRDMKFFG
jgi:hypothetical protein